MTSSSATLRSSPSSRQADSPVAAPNGIARAPEYLFARDLNIKGNAGR